MSYIWRQWFIGIVFELVFYGGLLLVPATALANAWDWWRAWIFLLTVVISTTLTMFIVFPGREDLLRERSKPLIQPGQPLSDRILVICLVLAFLGQIAVIPIDVFQWQVFAKPPALLSALGLVIFCLGWWVVSMVFVENAYASSVVKHQEERGHKVVDTGVYSIVRNPMYMGFVIMTIGMPLWLESFTGLIAALVPTIVLMIRILNEEQFLKDVLPGYAGYMQRVRYRLIPLIW